jgi:hypothetical protein
LGFAKDPNVFRATIMAELHLEKRAGFRLGSFWG